MISSLKLSPSLIFFFALFSAMPAAGAITFLNSFGSPGTGGGQFASPRGIAVAPSGQVYVADMGNHRVQRFDADGTYEIQWGCYGTSNGKFDDPTGIAVAATGQVYVADTDNDRIQRFDADGTYEIQWGSGGSGNGEFYYPYGVAVAPTGLVYVADTVSDRIQRFDADGTYQTKWGSSGSGDDQFDFPTYIAVAPAGHVYVADSYNDRTERFDGNGTYQTQWGSLGDGDGEFEFPTGIAVAATGQVYVADTNNHRIQRFDASGAYQTGWGSPGSGNGQFNSPYGVAVAPSGLVYVVDAGNHRIQRFFDSDAWASGTYLVSTNATIDSSEPLGSSLTVGAAMDLSVVGYVAVGGSGAGALTVGDGGSFSCGDNLLVAYGTGVLGTLTITGGGTVSCCDAGIALSEGSDGRITVAGSGSTWNVGGELRVGVSSLGTGVLTIGSGGSVVVDGTLFVMSSGSVNLGGGTLHAAQFDLYGSVDPVGFGSHLQVDGASMLQSVLTLDGGTFSTGSLVNPGLLQFNSGTFNLTGDDLLIGAGGSLGATVTLPSTKTVNVTGGTIINASGELELQQGVLTSGSLTNGGLIRGDGRINSPLLNGTNGEVRGQTDQRLLFTGGGNTNYGEIGLGGGTIEFSQDLTNQAGGFISGRGQLRVDGGLSNGGTIAFSGGYTDVYGDVANGASGQIIISGGSTTTFYDDVDTDGQLQVSEGCSAVFLGELSGTGGTSGSGTVYVEGDLRPGDSPAAVSFGGDLVFGAAATTEIELGGTEPGDEYDVVYVQAEATLDGQLIINLIDDFVPTLGDTFTIMSLASHVGQFDASDCLNVASGVYLLLQYSGTEVTLSATVLGDATGDGVVDAADAAALAGNWGQGNAAWAMGDFDFDDLVGPLDAAILAAHWGCGVGSSGETTSAVPEPSTLALLAWVPLVLLLRRRR